VTTSTTHDVSGDTNEFPFPLSLAQEQLWFLHQLEPRSPFYTIPMGLELYGHLDVEILRESLVEIVRRHESLRTTFITLDDRPVQVIGSSPGLDMSVVDLRALPLPERRFEAMRIVDEDVRSPFDLSRGPLLRARLLQIEADQHILLLSVHHIVFDDWSMRVFFRELAALYPAFLRGEASPLPAPSIQFADFAVWQREHVRPKEMDTDLAYWQDTLAGAPPTLDLPSDRPRPRVQHFHGSTFPVTLSETLVSDLASLSRGEGASLFMTLLAAFQTLLHRYTGVDDIVVGSPNAGRTRTELEDIIGFFVNTLVLRSKLCPDATFRQTLRQVRDVALDAYSHQDVPFHRLVEELQVHRDRSRNPLVQVVLTLQAGTTDTLTLPNLTIRPLSIYTGTSKFDLTLSLEHVEGGLTGWIEYNTDLFDASTISRFAGHFESLLRGIAADPDQRIDQLPIMSGVEREQILVGWNGTQTDYPAQRSISQLFEEQARDTPGAIALLLDQDGLTYGELNARANRLGHHLRKLGVGPEVPVGVCLERSIDMIVALLGILKAGGAYVPLDLTNPEERLTFMLHDTQAPLVVTQAALVERFPRSVQCVLMDRERLCIDRESRDNLEVQIAPETLAYVMYTSGSTGVPKGVCVTHRNVVRLVKETNYVRLDESETLLQFAPLAFDASTFEIWGALLNGARLVLFPGSLSSAEDMASIVQQHGVTTLWLTAGLFHQVVESQLPRLTGLRQLLAGGDTLSAPHVRKALKSLPRTALINGYGPTENTTFTCCHVMTSDSSVEDIVPIGRPVANTEVYILDSEMEPVPAGVEGELCAGGAGVARGYLNRPELNAEKFVPHPFKDDERLYRTGDRARYAADGTIIFLGRVDNQVKLRGFRVELGEIEAILATHPSVRDAAVIAPEDARGDRRLLAYVVLHEGSPLEMPHLRAYLEQKLPRYAVPSTFQRLRTLPLTANGKVDRHALPERLVQRDAAMAAFVPPKTTLHLQLAEIWEELFDVRPIGISDGFFDLGGNSLMTVRLLDRIKHVLGKRISVGALFEEPTIEHLTHVLLEREENAAAPTVVHIQAGEGHPPLFFFHGDLGSGGLYCVKLAALLGHSQPFYAMGPHGPDGRDIPDTIEEMAQSYLPILRQIQSHGPYLLGGFCLGALVAFELARQLQAEGQKVETLFLVNPSYASPRPRMGRELVQHVGDLLRVHRPSQRRLFSHLRRFNEHIEAWSKSHAKGDLLRQAVVELRSRMSARGTSRAQRSFQPEERLSGARPEHVEKYAWAIAGYSRKRYSGRVELFWSRDDISLPGDNRALGWDRVVDDIVVHTTPGTHLSAITRHIDVLAEEMSMCLPHDIFQQSPSACGQ